MRGRRITAGKAIPKLKGLRAFPPPPKGFNALAASPKELARHGLPQRFDPRTQPELAALWEQSARPGFRALGAKAFSRQEAAKVRGRGPRALSAGILRV